MTTQIFEIAQGTVTGREHRREGRNNQDASHVSRTVHTLAAIVCDGCSSAPHSEVGAQLASRFLTQHLTTLATANPYLTPDALLAHARAHLLTYLHNLALSLTPTNQPEEHEPTIQCHPERSEGS